MRNLCILVFVFLGGSFAQGSGDLELEKASDDSSEHQSPGSDGGLSHLDNGFAGESPYADQLLDLREEQPFSSLEFVRPGHRSSSQAQRADSGRRIASRGGRDVIDCAIKNGEVDPPVLGVLQKSVLNLDAPKVRGIAKYGIKIRRLAIKKTRGKPGYKHIFSPPTVFKDGLLYFGNIPEEKPKKEDPKKRRKKGPNKKKAPPKIGPETYRVQVKVRRGEYKYLKKLRKFDFGSSVYLVKENKNLENPVAGVSADDVGIDDFSIRVLAVRVLAKKRVLQFDFSFDYLKPGDDTDKDLVFFIHFPATVEGNVSKKEYDLQVHFGFRTKALLGDRKIDTFEPKRFFACENFRPEWASRRTKSDIDNERRIISDSYNRRIKANLNKKAQAL